MASAVVNGLLLSTVMTLLLTPALLVLPGAIASRLGIKSAQPELTESES